MFAELTLSEPGQSIDSGSRYLTKTTAFLYPTMAIIFLSLIALAINHFHYHYPGISYFPDCSLLAGNLFLLYCGFFLLQGRNGNLTHKIRETAYFIAVMAVIILATNAAQYTPFPTIDHHILKFESFINMDTNALMTWTNSKPLLKTVLIVVYGSLDYQLCCIPLVILLAGRTDLIREFYFLLLTTVLIGFTWYYFFPTTAPASVIHSDYFTESQQATYLKFFQLHHYIHPATTEGGMIALPSFHVIWAYLCLRLVRRWLVAFLILLPINVVLMFSCVLLGWHYCLDVLASAVVIIFSHKLYGYFRID